MCLCLHVCIPVPWPYRKRLSVAHTKTMKMSDDVLGVKYSPDQRLLAVALLDSTVKVFFADSLKVGCPKAQMCLGHLPSSLTLR